MLDVLEKAGLIVNVAKGDVQENKLKLNGLINLKNKILNKTYPDSFYAHRLTKLTILERQIQIQSLACFLKEESN